MPRLSYKFNYEIPENMKKYLGDNALAIITVLGRLPSLDTCKKLAEGTPKQITDILNNVLESIVAKEKKLYGYCKNLSDEEFEKKWLEIDREMKPLVNSFDTFLEFCVKRGGVPEKSNIGKVQQLKTLITPFYKYCKSRVDNRTEDYNSLIAEQIFLKKGHSSALPQFNQVFTADGKPIPSDDFAAMGNELAAGKELVFYFSDTNYPNVVKIDSMVMPPKIIDLPFDKAKYQKAHDARNQYLGKINPKDRFLGPVANPNQVQKDRVADLLKRQEELTNEQIELLKKTEINFREIDKSLQHFRSALRRVMLDNVMAVYGLNYSMHSFCKTLSDLVEEGKNLDEIKTLYPEESKKYEAFLDGLYSAAVLDKNALDKNLEIAKDLAKDVKFKKIDLEEEKSKLEAIGAKLKNKVGNPEFEQTKKTLFNNMLNNVFETKHTNIGVRWVAVFNQKPGISQERIAEIAQNCKDPEYKKNLLKEIVNDILSFPPGKIGNISVSEYVENYSKYEYLRLITWDSSYLNDKDVQDTINELFPTEEDRRNFYTLCQNISLDLSNLQARAPIVFSPYASMMDYDSLSNEDVNKLFSASSGKDQHDINMFLSDVARGVVGKLSQEKAEEARNILYGFLKVRPLKKPDLLSSFSDEQFRIFEEETRSLPYVSVLGFSKSNSPEYEAIKRELAPIKRSRVNSRGIDALQYKPLYDALRNYVFNRGPVPSTDKGKERFNASMDMLYSLGLQLMDFDTSNRITYERDLKVMALRSNNFRQKLINDNSNIRLKKFAENVQKTFGTADIPEKVAVTDKDISVFLTKHEEMVRVVRAAELDKRLDQNPDAKRRYEEYKAEREPFIKYIQGSPNFISDEDIKELALDEEFYQAREHSKRYLEQSSKVRTIVDKNPSSNAGMMGRGLDSQIKVDENPENDKYNRNLSEMLNCPEGKIMFGTELIKQLGTETDVSKFFEKDILTLGLNADKYGRETSLSFVAKTAAFGNLIAYELNPLIEEFSTYNNSVIEGGVNVNTVASYYGGIGCLLFNKNIDYSDMVLLSRPKEEFESKGKKALADQTSNVIDIVSSFVSIHSDVKGHNAVIDLKEKGVFSKDYRYLKAYAIKNGQKTRIKLEEAFKSYGVDKESVSFEVMSQKEKQALDEAFKNPVIPKEMPDPGALGGEGLVNECREMLSWIEKLDDDYIKKEPYFLEIKETITKEMETGFKTSEESRDSLRRIANSASKFHKAGKYYFDPDSSYDFKSKLSYEIASKCYRKLGLIAYQEHCKDIGVNPVKYEYKQPYKFLPDKTKEICEKFINKQKTDLIKDRDTKVMTVKPKENLKKIAQTAKTINNNIANNIITKDAAAEKVCLQVLNPMRENIAFMVVFQQLVNENYKGLRDNPERMKDIKKNEAEMILKLVDGVKKNDIFIEMTDPKVTLSGWRFDQLINNDEYIKAFTEDFCEMNNQKKLEATKEAKKENQNEITNELPTKEVEKKSVNKKK